MTRVIRTIPYAQTRQMFSYTPSGRVLSKWLALDSSYGAASQVWPVGYSYNQMGQAVSTTYPGSANGGFGNTYTVGYDALDRPATLTDGGGVPYVQTVTYNAANQPTQTKFQMSSGYSFYENRGYSAMNQLTHIDNYTGGFSVNYNYLAGADNGQISSAVDNNVTISYAYDALKRLTSAVGSGSWSQSYGYDGFGNMTSKTGSGLTFTNTVDQTTNRLTGGSVQYDANGNLITDQNGAHYTYDVANRMVSAGVAGGTEYYQYTADNKRVVTYGTGGTTVFIYGAFGEKLATVNGGVYNNVYFAGRLIARDVPAGFALDSYFVAVDRLGSVRTSSYLPYGEEISATANGTVKFATYTRDASTGLDYADQRYYTSTFGRFMSADRYSGSFNPTFPATANKFSFLAGDPVNLIDPTGEDADNFDSTNSGDGSDCPDRQKLTDKIRRYILGSKDNKGLLQRISEQVNGKFDPTSGDWVTHNDQIVQRENGLRKVLDQWNTDNCGDPPYADAWKLATRGPVQDWEYKGSPTARLITAVRLMYLVGPDLVGFLSTQNANLVVPIVATVLELVPKVTTTISYAP